MVRQKYTRRQVLRTGASLGIAGIAGCSSSDSNDGSTSTPTTTARSPPKDPYYPDGLNGEEILRNHREGLRQWGGYDLYSIFTSSNANRPYTTVSVTDHFSEARATYTYGNPGEIYDKKINIYYTNPKTYAREYTYEEGNEAAFDNVKFMNPPCGILHSFSSLGMVPGDIASTLISSSNFVYDGVSEDYPHVTDSDINVIPLQKYTSIGPQMVSNKDAFLDGFKQAIPDSYYKSEDSLSINEWTLKLWFDTNQVARYHDFYCTVSNGAKEFNMDRRVRVSKRSGSEGVHGRWLNNAKAAVDGTDCERFFMEE